MNAWFLLIPIVSFAAGALLFRLILFLFLRPSAFHFTMTEMMSWMIEQGLFTDPSSLQKMLPLAEEHMDHFLRHKLSATMPQVSFFIGDKTIHQFKKIFMEELEEWLPGFIQSYVRSLTENIASVTGDPVTEHDGLRSTLAKKISKLLVLKAVWIGGLLGMVLSGIEWLLIYGAHFLHLTKP